VWKLLKASSFCGTLSQTLYRGSAPGFRWGTSVPRAPEFSVPVFKTFRADPGSSLFSPQTELTGWHQYNCYLHKKRIKWMFYLGLFHCHTFNSIYIFKKFSYSARLWQISSGKAGEWTAAPFAMLRRLINCVIISSSSIIIGWVGTTRGWTSCHVVAERLASLWSCGITQRLHCQYCV